MASPCTDDCLTASFHEYFMSSCSGRIVRMVYSCLVYLVCILLSTAALYVLDLFNPGRGFLLSHRFAATGSVST